MKKILMSVVALGGLFAMALSVSAGSYRAADVDCNGTVSADDARVIMAAYVTGRGLPDPYGGAYSQPDGCGARLDITCDGAVNMADVIAVKSIMEGETYPRQCRAQK